MLKRALLLLVAALAVSRARAGLLGYYAEILQRSLETQDPQNALEVWAEPALLVANGVQYVGKERIAAYLARHFGLFEVHRHRIISPVYENGRVAHYLQLAFYQAPSGCSSLVQSFEEAEFDVAGRVVSLRSEWDLSEEDWRGDLACSHEQHEGSGAHRSTIRRQMIDFVFTLHRAIETLSMEQLLAHFEPTDVRVSLYGGGEFKGAEGARQLFARFFAVAQHVVFAPTSPVVVGARSVSVASCLFVTTKSGCARAYDVVLLGEMSEGARLRLLRVFVAEKEGAEFFAELERDCSAPASARDKEL